MQDRLVQFVVLLCIACPAVVRSEESLSQGRLCIASAPPPTSGSKSLSNPTGGNPDVAYSIKIGSAEPVIISRLRGTWIEDLDTKQRYPIIVFENGVRTASFFLNYSNGENSRCLFLNSLYLTWQLWPMTQTGSWCDCDQE